MLFQSVAFLSSRNHSTSDLHAEAKAFLRADSPLLELPRLASPPLFPRDRCPGYHSSHSGAGHNHLVLGDLSDLPAVVPLVALTDEAHEELYKQHMVVVDGWRERYQRFPHNAAHVRAPQKLTPSRLHL